MPQPTVSVEPAGSRPADSEFYRWEVSGKPLAIEIRLDVIERLDREVVQTFRAITSRGSEVGGILLGRIRQQPRPTVIIEDYEAVPCDYRRGPLYLLAEEDRLRLQQALTRWREQPPRDCMVVGFYRSNTRRELVLDDEDLALINEYFREPHHVFLLIKPFAAKANLAGFFLREGAQVPRESSLTFPFNRAELVKSGARAATAATPPAAQAETPPPPVAKTETGTPPAPAPKAATGSARVPIEIRIAVPLEPPAAAPPAAPREPEIRARAADAAAAPSAGTPENVKPGTQGTPASVPAATPDGKGITAPQPQQVPERRASAPATRPEPKATPTDGHAPAQRQPSAAAPVKATPSADGKTAVTVKPPAEIRRGRPEEPVQQTEPAAAGDTAAAPQPVTGSLLTLAGAGPGGAETRVEARPSSKRRLWIGLALLLVAIAAGLIFWLRARSAAPTATPEASALGLRVERSGGQLLLSWNRSLPLLQTAQRAILSISDGDHREDVEMDLGQLRGGSIVYSPITSDVSFRLEVTDLRNGKSVSESVRVLGGKPSPSGPPTDAGAAARTPAPSGTQPASPTPEAPKPAQELRTMMPPPSPQPRESLAARLTVPTDLLAPAEPPKAEPPVSASQPPVTPPPQEVKAQPQATTTSGTGQPAAQVIQPATQPATPPVTQASKPAAEPPPAAQAAKPAAETSQPAAQAARPAPQAPEPVKVGGVVQEAKLIQRRDPVYPALARQARLQGVVRLEAVIGTDGRVESVRAISGPPLLRQAAIDAVKQWVYQPGTLNGKPVRVTTQIEINFTLGR